MRDTFKPFFFIGVPHPTPSPTLLILFPSLDDYFISLLYCHHHEQPRSLQICHVCSQRNIHPPCRCIKMPCYEQEYISSINHTRIHPRRLGHSFDRIPQSTTDIYLVQMSSIYYITPTPFIHWTVDLCILWKKDNGQVKILLFSWWIWGTKPLYGGPLM